MRVAHRDGRDFERAVADLDRHVDRRVAGQERGISAAPAGSGVPMSTRTRRTRPPSTSRSSVRTPRPVSIFNCFLLGDAVVEHILGDAANAVAAHLAFGAVGVEHPHSGVGPLGGHDQDQAVAADAEVAVADGPRQRGRVVRGRLVERADIHVIVADPCILVNRIARFSFSRGAARGGGRSSWS